MDRQKENQAIEVKNLVKKYGQLYAINNISFSVKEKEIFGFLGPNGAGKTTVIKILTTLQTPSSGKVFVNRFDVLKQKDSVRKSFGIVFQDPSLDDELTALENMQFHAVLYSIPKNIAKKKIENLLKFVDLWERRNSLVKTFSGGMRRRLEIARGFLHHPKILFLDEPTLGLDPQTRNFIWQYIKDLNRTEGTTIFFTTHYMEEAEEMATKIAIINKGKLIAEGTPQELKKDTQTNTLEKAYLTLVGNKTKEEAAQNIESLRKERKFWSKK